MHVLLAIDQSAASDRAVAFVADVLAARSGGVRVTLLHVVESLPDYLRPRAGDPGRQAEYAELQARLEQSKQADGQQRLDETKQKLVTAGFPDAAVATKLVVRDARPEAGKVIAALAIIDEMQSSDCDVVCLGRRGTGASGAALGGFPGSVAEKVLRVAQGKTVWVVD